MTVNYTSSTLLSSNGSPHHFYSPNPEPLSKRPPYARMTVTGIHRETKHIITASYLLRPGMDAPIRIGRIFDQIYKTVWEWFAR